ncbi:MAG: DUF4440 domain-containing protein [Bacteroidota bacterium]
MKNPIPILVLLAVMASCQNHVIDQKAEAERLMELSPEWAKAAVDGDPEKAVSFWADDAIVISQNEPALKGIDSIRAMVNRSMQIPGFEIGWEPQEAFVSQSGDLGYVLIKNYMKFPAVSLGNVPIVYNKGVEIWKKREEGSWKNVVDIFNRDPWITSID